MIFAFVFLAIIGTIGAFLYAWLSERARGESLPLRTATLWVIRCLGLIGGLAFGLSTDLSATLFGVLRAQNATGPLWIEGLIGLGIALVMLGLLWQQIGLHRHAVRPGQVDENAGPFAIRRSFILTGLVAGLVAHGLITFIQWSV